MVRSPVFHCGRLSSSFARWIAKLSLSANAETLLCVLQLRNHLSMSLAILHSIRSFGGGGACIAWTFLIDHDTTCLESHNNEVRQVTLFK